MELSNSQIDRLGERLKSGQATDDDLKLLAEYRKTFDVPFVEVLHQIESVTGLIPTVRTAKTTESIVAKLKRERTSLSRMQDLAGCRLVVRDIPAEDQIVEKLDAAFAAGKRMDRRIQPNNGYRAVHLIVRHQSKRIEIQIRTQLQQLWAEFSEKVTDQIDRRAKYGAAPAWLQSHLMEMSAFVADVETVERELHELRTQKQSGDVNISDEQLGELTRKLESLRDGLRQTFIDRFVRIMIERDLHGDDNAFLD